MGRIVGLTPQEDSVVFRMSGFEGRPGVKLASSAHNVGLALIREEGEYIQVFPEGVKVTRNGRLSASWP